MVAADETSNLQSVVYGDFSVDFSAESAPGYSPDPILHNIP